MVPVLVDSWQVECCLPPPSVGDDVAWRLRLEGAAGDPVCDVGLDVQAEPRAWDGATLGRYGTVLTWGAVTAWWEPREPVAGRREVRGVLLAEHHDRVPTDLPATAGRVRRVRVQERSYARVDGGTSWVWADARPRYRDVGSSPRWFRGVDHRSPGPLWVESGALVDLEVVGAAAGTVA